MAFCPCQGVEILLLPGLDRLLGWRKARKAQRTEQAPPAPLEILCGVGIGPRQAGACLEVHLHNLKPLGDRE